MTTTFNAEQILAANKAAAAEATELANSAFAGFEKLAAANMAAAKSAMADSMDSFKSILGAKSPQEVLAAQTAMVQPLASKAAAYGRTVYEIAAETSAELSKSAEGKIAEGQKAFGAAIESMTKNAPAGTESAVAAFKSAVATGQQVIESAQAAAKRAVAQAQQNMTVATDVAVKAANKATKK